MEDGTRGLTVSSRGKATNGPHANITASAPFVKLTVETFKNHDPLPITVTGRHDVRSVATGNDRLWCHCYYSVDARPTDRKLRCTSITVRREMQDNFETYVMARVVSSSN